MAPYHVPLLLLALLGQLLPSATAASHPTSPASIRAHIHHHGHHHRSPTTTATAAIGTAPSMHQNHLDLEAGRSLLVVEPFITAASQAPSGEEAMVAMAAAATPAEPMRLDLPQAPSPPPSFDPAADPTSPTTPLPQGEVEGFASGVASPPLGEPAATTTTQPQGEVEGYASSVASPPPLYEPAATTTTRPQGEVEGSASGVASPPLGEPAVTTTTQPQGEVEGYASSVASPPPLYEPAATTTTQPQGEVEGSASGVASPPLGEPAATTTTQPHGEVEGYASGVASPPPLYEPAATTTPLPLPNPYNAAANPPVTIHDSAEAMVVSGDDLGPQQLAKVLTSLGYNEMASAATLLADTPSVSGWPGAMTVFAAPDVFLQASCPGCSRRHLLLEHIALGYFPFSSLAAAPTVKLPSASVGFCLNIVAEPGPFVIHNVKLYVDGVEISHPELYNDGRYVVHGIHGFVPPLAHAFYEDGHHHHRRHHLTARSPATSAATAASVVRIMIRDAISRLQDGGYGFVSRAMRSSFTELEKFANLTVFALDDQAIFTGEGNDYVSSLRFHIVPGHRLTRANLLQLRPGTKLPTLAGEDQKLVITHSAGSGSDEVQINYIPVKEPNVVVNLRVVVHGIYVPFPRLHLANLASSMAAASTIEVNDTCNGGCASISRSSTVSAAHVHGVGLISAIPHHAVKDRAAGLALDDEQCGRRNVTASAVGPQCALKPARLTKTPSWSTASRSFPARRVMVQNLSENANAKGGAAAGAAFAAAGAGLVAAALRMLAQDRKRKMHKKRKSKMLQRHVELVRTNSNSCGTCLWREIGWRVRCCGSSFCQVCVVEGFLKTHGSKYKMDGSFCLEEGCLEAVVPPEFHEVHRSYFYTDDKEDGPNMIVKKFVNLEDLQNRVQPRRLHVWVHRLHKTWLGEQMRSPEKK